MPNLGALAIAKAHPLVFGAVLAAAIGIVVYQLVKPKKQKKLRYSNSFGGPSRDDGDDGSPGQSEFYYYDRETKSVTNSAPASDTSKNNLRKRNVAPKSSSSDTNKSHSETKLEKTEAVSQEVPPEKEKGVSKEVQTESNDINQNNDNNKVLPNKNIDSEISVDEKVESYFLKNISGADSTDSNDESDSTDSNDESDSTNSIFKPVKKCCNCGSHSDENCSTSSSDSESASSSWSNISYTDVDNMNKIQALRSPSVCSVASIDSESSSFTVLSGDSELCRGCEQNPVNTHTQPCNHRYMCSDCAPRIFRLFKRCKVCRARIERIVVEE